MRPAISFNVTAADRDELEGKLRLLLGQIEDSRNNKKKRPATLSPSSYTSPSPSKKMKATTKSPAVALGDRETEGVAAFVPEPVVQDLTVNKIFESFTAGKSVVAAHYTKVTEEMPDAKMTVKQLRKELIDNMYSEDELRELADGAQIKHGRIIKSSQLSASA